MNDTADDGTDLATVWQRATEQIAETVDSAQQRAYLRRTELRAIVQDTALLSVPDAFTRDQIEMKLRPTITDALSRQLGRAVQVAVTLTAPDDTHHTTLGTMDPAPDGDAKAPAPAPRSPSSGPPHPFHSRTAAPAGFPSGYTGAVRGARWRDRAEPAGPAAVPVGAGAHRHQRQRSRSR
jgi:chromosomal replication initiator protein